VHGELDERRGDLADQAEPLDDQRLLTGRGLELGAQLGQLHLGDQVRALVHQVHDGGLLFV